VSDRPGGASRRRASAIRAIAVSPIALWAAFVLVHFWLGMLCLYAPGLPLGDVTIVYRFWMDQAFVAHYWVGIDSGWVYPIGALVPMAAARVFGPALYASTWLSLVMVLDAVAFAALIGWGRRRASPGAAWWWLGFLLLLGPIALGRIDSITVPLAIVGVLMIASRPWAATVILTVAAWIKVWPAAIVVAMLVAVRGRRRILASAAVTSLVIVAVALALGSGWNVFSFVTEQTGRGLQVEAPVATPWLWRALAGMTDSGVYYDNSILTWQVRGDGVDLAAAIMTPLLAAAVIAVVILGVLAIRGRAHASEVLPALALAVVTAFIAFNKVGSPQYMTWLAVPVILGLVTARAGHGIPFRTPAILVAVLAALTQVVYPYLYLRLLSLDVIMLIVISAKDILLFVLLGWAVHALWGSARGPGDDPVPDGGGRLPSPWPFATGARRGTVDERAEPAERGR